MQLDDLIGARLAVGIPGTEATDEVIRALHQTHAQSLVIFSRNFTSPEQFAALLRRLEEALQRRLLILVDHEGGRVIHFGQALTRFPAPLAQAKTEGPEGIERQGLVEATELKRLGVHVNLAPVVDVLIEGCDPVIGDRSYGSDPDRVSALGVARIRGLQSHGIAACAKHFPGLGAVPRDPHKVLPTIGLDWSAIEEIHLPPFQAAVEAGVATVMSSHVCYPGLGEPDGLPATFSRNLIHGLLRERLRFEGAILTDALEMGALRVLGTIGESSVRAAEAGHDVFLICCADLEPAKEALSCLRAAYQTGRLDPVELEVSVERIRQLREKYLPGTLEESR